MFSPVRQVNLTFLHHFSNAHHPSQGVSLSCNGTIPLKWSYVKSAAVGASFDPSWDYGAGLKQEVLGTKWMYLLLKAPKGLTNGRALLDVEADVLVRGVRLPVTFWHKQEQAARQLTVSLWG